MNLQDIVEPLPTISQHSQGSRVSRAETWDSCKDRIYDVYITKGNTLSTTMKLFEREYGLKACTRTWKSKLKEWKYDKYSTGKDKPPLISNVEEGVRDEAKMTVIYPLPIRNMASDGWFLTARNDCSLFFASRAAGLVRISVRNLPDGWKGEDMAEEPLGKALWERLCHSEIYPWCVSCLKTIGAVRNDCQKCQHFLDPWFPSFCRTCYNNDKSICLAEGHKLQNNIISVRSECFIARNPEEERWCDAFNCGKKISGLYFHCCACKDDKFCICLQCAMGGRGCRDLKHELSAGVKPI